MQPFEYSRAASVEAAAAAALEGRTALIAGGTELVNFLKEGIEAPARLVDINRLTELDYVRLDETQLAVGALARMSRVAAD
ncbi:MAG TPA: FAD binding domain-containing protein, partial [Woeseiaceae bacterium]|nr:FAD binding domain-containing protein [Woeseiaceae bacterium]